LRTESKAIIFADIDGTILDANNSFQETKPIIRQLLGQGAILVLCSSKTKGEIEFYQKKLDVKDPFVVENGGAIFIPKNYFPFPIPGSKSTCEYEIVELGMSYATVREKLAKACTKAGVTVVGFGDMSFDKIAANSKLPLPLAVLAKKRMYEEPFVMNQKDKKRLEEALETEGLTLTSGDVYMHVGGNTDKGKATTVLKKLFQKKYGNIVTYGVGNSQNDLPMLSAVNVPMLVRRTWGGLNASLPVWRNIFQFCFEQAKGNY
jgi:mannosyl-3-phosphoglycerate phosphatase